MIILYITIVLFVLYGLLIAWYGLSWQSIPVYEGGTGIPGTKVSLIIPARNEAGSIGALLTALGEQTFPKSQLEIIVVDDHSTDGTAGIVRQFSSARLISLKEDGINSYKKKAIETGIGSSSGELIVTTDADCMPSPTWLENLVKFQQERNAIVVTAPVAIDCNSSLVQVFQAMDFMVLQGITGAAVHRKLHGMGNGANLAYRRDAFERVGGFRDIDTIASGDDMLLIQKIQKQFPGGIHYLKSKEAIVYTQPQKTWTDFFSQRIRWASKARYYKDGRTLPVLLLVYLFNLCFPALIIAALFNPYYWQWVGIYWIAKTLIEFPFFNSLANFFNKKWSKPWFFFFQPLHIFYTVLSGTFSQFGKYQWKGRRVR